MFQNSVPNQRSNRWCRACVCENAGDWRLSHMSSRYSRTVMKASLAASCKWLPSLRICLLCWLAVILLGSTAANCQESPGQLSVQLSPTSPARAKRPPGAAEIAKTIKQLDASSFDIRNQATEQILASGSAAIPYLVRALSADSREVRFRAAALLRHTYAFEDVVPALMMAARKTDARLVCSILREHTVQQLNAITTFASAEQLLNFWGTSINAYRRTVLNAMAEARDGAALAGVVAPLLTLKSHAEQFEQITARMDRCWLSHKSRYSATYIVAQTLAHGLRRQKPQAISFAKQYVEAMETLRSRLQSAGRTRSAIRKEITDRAVYSQGAAAFLAETLDPKAPASILMTKLGISSARLRHEFFTGLAESDDKECYRRIGKTHIVDMLTELFEKWPNFPDEASVTTLVQATIATTESGDKPKALALLGALEDCRDLEPHHLSLQHGLGKQLAQRLTANALQAPNNRAFHPTRMFHNRIIALYDLGITNRHPAFPKQLVAHYIDGTENVLAQQSRQTFDRYVRTLTLLKEAKLPFDNPELRPFIALLQAHLTKRPELVAAGLTKVMRLVEQTQYRGHESAPEEIAKQLGMWVEQQTP